MADHSTVADVPDLTTLDAGAELPTGRIVVAKLGDYKDKRYGAFGITDAHVTSWQKNLHECFDGRLAIDFDHSPEKGKGTKAAGWVTSLERKTGAQLAVEDPGRFSKLDPGAVYVASDVEFSKAGADAIRNKEYRYISPTFVDNFTDEHGTKHGPAAIGAGFTNRPFLRRGMPAISLSADEWTTPAEETPARSSDSRGRMPDLKEIAKRLGLAEDADEAKILDALPGADGPVKVVTLAEYTTLVADAAAGKVAAQSAATDKFETAWTKALDEGRVAPASKSAFDGIRALDVDLAVKTLDGLPQVVKTKPAGHGHEKTPGGAGAGDAPEGVDAERFELDQKVQAKMLELATDDYGRALDVVMAAEAVTA